MASLFKQFRARLSALAWDLEFGTFAGKTAIGMVRTDIDRIQVSAFFSQFPFQPSMNSGYFSLGRFAPGDHRLVCQNYEAVPSLPECSQRRSQCRHQAPL